LRHSRSRLNLFDKARDQQEPQIMIVTAGPTDIKLQNPTPVPHAT
jgi:hypothetical protein